MNLHIASKFRGCVQVGYMDNPNTGQHLRIYKVPNEQELLGVNDGSSCWLAHPEYSLHKMKKGISPNHPAATRERHKLLPESGARHVLVSRTQTVRRRLHVNS